MNTNILGDFQVYISVPLKIPFSQDISRQLLLIHRKFDIQTFNSKYLNPNSNSNNSVLINIVGTLYLMSRNVDLVLSSYFQNFYFKFELLQEQCLA